MSAELGRCKMQKYDKAITIFNKELQTLVDNVKGVIPSNTGKTALLVTFKVEASDEKLSGTFFYPIWLPRIFTGIAPSQVLYNPNVRTGVAYSEYINGLKEYAETKLGASEEKEALSIAFAIARKQYEEGSLAHKSPSAQLENVLNDKVLIDIANNVGDAIVDDISNNIDEVFKSINFE